MYSWTKKIVLQGESGRQILSGSIKTLLCWTNLIRINQNFVVLDKCRLDVNLIKGTEYFLPPFSLSTRCIQAAESDELDNIPGAKQNKL